MDDPGTNKDNDIKKEEENTSDNENKLEKRVSELERKILELEQNNSKMEIKYTKKVTEAVISKMEEFREIERRFSVYERKVYKEIEAKEKDVVNKVREFEEKMKDDVWQHLEDKKKEIKSEGDLEKLKYSGISFEEEETTDARIEKLFGTIFPCAELKISDEQKKEFKELTVPVPSNKLIADGYQIVHDFNCEDLTDDGEETSEEDVGDEGDWSFKVKKRGKCLDFRPIIKDLRPLNRIIHFRIYLIWNNKPQRYLQMVHTMTENQPGYKKLLDWKKLPVTDHTDQFKIRCIMKIMDKRAKAKLPEISYPDGGKELTEEEEEDYYLTVNPKQIEEEFTCDELNEDENGIKSITITTDLGFSWRFEVKRIGNYLRVKPVVSKLTKAAAESELIIYFKYYLIWNEEPENIFETERTIKDKNQPGYENLIFWHKLQASTEEFKIRFIIVNVSEKEPLPKN